MMGQALLSLALSSIGRDALNVVAGLVLALVLALAFAISSLTAMVGAAATGHAIVGAQIDEIPSDQLDAMQAAAASCGLPWTVLAALSKVESDFGRNMATSTAGAIGYGQFLHVTWAAYGQGGDPYDYRDAIPAMARYLCAHGGAEDLRRAVFAYNHAEWYVDLVLATAAQYREPMPRGIRAASGERLPEGLGPRVVAIAEAQMGKPYVWGGASPATSFDCSGLVQWAYRQVGVALPRTAQQQFDATIRLAPDELEPGDLAFFAHTYQTDPAEPVTHVGLYVGNGRMLNAPAEGDVIREMPVFTGFWGAHYAGGGRVWW